MCRFMTQERFSRQLLSSVPHFQADESQLLVSSDADGVFNAYAQAVAGGKPRPLTASKKNAIRIVSYFPQDDRFLYTQDGGGNELNHLYVQNSDGSIRDLTPGKSLKADFIDWAGDLRYFYVISNERDARYFDLYRYGAASYERTLLFKNTTGYLPQAVSRDGRWLALVKARTNADNDLYLWDSSRPEHEPERITPHQGDVEHAVQTFSPDSKTFYYSSNQDSEFQRIWSRNLATGARKAAVQDKWDVVRIAFSWKGRYQVVSTNAEARTVTTITDLETGKQFRCRSCGTPMSVASSLGGVRTYWRSMRTATPRRPICTSSTCARGTTAGSPHA